MGEKHIFVLDDTYLSRMTFICVWHSYRTGDLPDSVELPSGQYCMLGPSLMRWHFDLPGSLSASSFLGIKMVLVSLTFRISAGPQIVGNFCTFLFRPLTLGSKGYSSGIQDHV